MQARTEHDDHEFNARFDDIRERYAASVPDPELEHAAWLSEQQAEDLSELTAEQHAARLAVAERAEQLRNLPSDNLPF